MATPPPSPLEELASAVRARAWELAVDVVEEGLLDDQLPSLQRLGRLGQLGDMPTFIAELARELQQPQPERLGLGSALGRAVPQETSVQRAAVPGRVDRHREAAETVRRALVEQRDAGP